MPYRLATLLIGATSMAALPVIAETRTYNVPDFDSIDVSAGIKVIYETGVPRSVTVENKDGDFSGILVEVDEDELKLERPRKSGGWGTRRKAYTVRVGVQDLNEIEASSGARIEGTGLSGPEAEVDVSSGASARITDISAETVEADASSGSSMSLSGNCQQLTAEASSGSKIDARGLQCAELSADVSSGASIKASASDRVNAEASSGGGISVKGGATTVTVDESSGGSVSIS